VNTKDQSTRNISALDLLLFERYQVINVTAATNDGSLDKGDANCAVSTPNALRNIPSSGIYAPSFIIGNNTALEAHGLADSFDLRGFSIKPLGDNARYTYMIVYAWEIDHEAKVPRKNPHSLFMGWGPQTGHLRPLTIQPASYFPGWGKGVNWIEFRAKTWDGKDLDFSVDNLLLDFHDVYEGQPEWSYGFHDGLGPVVAWDEL
jgi:hypothetical protein